MEHGTANEIALSGYQLQAARRNKLEHHRLERQMTLMHDDLQQRLTRLRRQARYLRGHYTNVVKVVKPDRRYQLWKEAHALEIKQAERQDWLEEIEDRQRSKRERCPPRLLSNETSHTSTRPLLLLYNDDLTTPVKNVHRLTTSSIHQHHVSPLAMLNEHVPHPRNHLRTQPSRPKALPCLPLIGSAPKRNAINRQ